MARWVIDASVAAKWLAPEAESAQAEALLDDDLLAPDLLFAEVANILWTKQTRSEMTAATAAATARWLQQVPLQVHDGAGLMDDALALAVRLKHPASDCMSLALARQTGCPLITADRRLFERWQRTDAADLAGLVVWLGGPVAPLGG
jgi:predicted nucleic acid-binding protein